MWFLLLRNGNPLPSSWVPGENPLGISHAFFSLFNGLCYRESFSFHNCLFRKPPQTSEVRYCSLSLRYPIKGGTSFFWAPIHRCLGVKYGSPGTAGERYLLQCALFVFCLVSLLWALLAPIWRDRYTDQSQPKCVRLGQLSAAVALFVLGIPRCSGHPFGPQGVSISIFSVGILQSTSRCSVLCTGGDGAV